MSFLKKGCAIASAIVSAVFTVVPEEIFKQGFIICSWPDSFVIVTNRLLICVVASILSCIGYLCYLKLRRTITISDKTATIKIECADLFNAKKGKILINFDECFSTNVGDKPEDIKPGSVCGQYLAKYPIDNIQSLIQSSGIQSSGVSHYGNKPKYESGTIFPRDKFLLMAFAKLDERGLGYMTYREYLDCLDKLWEQIDYYHGTDDVYLPILGSRITRFDKDLSQQELLDIMIASYRLSPKKMKKTNVLHIVCKEREGFSLNDITGV